MVHLGRRRALGHRQVREISARCGLRPATLHSIRTRPGFFAYASLMWRPGFEFTEAAPATLFGYVRDMCFLSWHYRGTREVPGLVCGLTPAPGAICRGRAYRVAPARLCAVVDYLDGRELISHIYVPRHLAITLADGRTALARAYVADTMHEQFAGDLGPLQKSRGHCARSRQRGAQPGLSRRLGCAPRRLRHQRCAAA